jgi:phosphoribosyl 1,2-cyclic phosphodiesterase
MRFSVLASGSSGNSCYIESMNCKILVDAGLSCQEIIRRLRSIDVNPGTLDAIIITHEHIDHIKGVGVLSRRFNIPVVTNKPTLQRALHLIGDIRTPFFINTGEVINIKDITVETFTKCHDAVDPMGIAISSNGRRLGILTDLGRSSHLIEERLKNCHGLIIEFNHDISMLDEGPYPLHLKRRIKGPEGHLSNAQGADILKRLYHDDMTHIVLAHLSKVNNIDTRAYREAEDALSHCNIQNDKIIISYQDIATPLMEL